MRLAACLACLVAACAVGAPASAQVVPAASTEPAISLFATPAPPAALLEAPPAVMAATPPATEPVVPVASTTPLLDDAAALLPLDAQPVATAPAPVLAFEYSEGYRQRARIHKLASWATLPLFGAEAIVGTSLYSNPTGTKRDVHLALGAGIGALFAVNTVTGVWNLLEARKDPSFGKRKWIHSLLMMGADVGFVATAATGPEGDGSNYNSQRSTHRAIVFSSIAMSTTAYLIMLLGN